MKKDEIKKVLNIMSDSIDREQVELYKSLVDKKCFDEVKDYEQFYFGLIYPHDQFMSGLIKNKISDNRDVVFLFKNSRSIEGHFRYWIEKTEGFSCCADKSRTIIRSLIKFYEKGDKIEFNYTQKYTFHLPRIIFKTHDDIISFYDAVKDLNCGNPTKYLLSLKKLIRGSTTLKQNTEPEK